MPFEAAYLGQNVRLMSVGYKEARRRPPGGEARSDPPEEPGSEGYGAPGPQGGADGGWRCRCKADQRSGEDERQEPGARCCPEGRDDRGGPAALVDSHPAPMLLVITAESLSTIDRRRSRRAAASIAS